MKKWIQIGITWLLWGLLVAHMANSKPVLSVENSWENPEFVNWFTGTYAFNGQINPQINRDEQALFQSIAQLMNSSAAEAISAIRQYIEQTQQPGTENKGEYSPALDYTIANLYLQTGALESAIEAYKTSIKRFPTFQRAHQNLGLSYVQSGDFKAAIPALTKGIELGATGGIVWGLLGFSYLNTERPTQALTAYEQALVFQPESRDWRLGKLNSLLDMGDRFAAIALLDELLAEDISDTGLWLQQANAFLGEGKTLEAAANLEWVARSGAASGQSMVLLGDIYLNEGLPVMAVSAYNKATALGSVSPDRLLRVVDGLMVRGATEEAIEVLHSVQEALQSELTDGQALRALNLEARLQLANGEKEMASVTLEKILKRDPMNGSALLSLGDYYAEIGEMERAIMQFERASKVEDVQSQALLGLARLYVRQRDYRSALIHLRDANRIDPRPYVADYIVQLEEATRNF
jgi:tetratricopeptide (TPR) repeat protein